MGYVAGYAILWIVVFIAMRGLRVGRRCVAATGTVVIGVMYHAIISLHGTVPEFVMFFLLLGAAGVTIYAMHNFKDD